jgi:hypothetical protein
MPLMSGGSLFPKSSPAATRFEDSLHSATRTTPSSNAAGSPARDHFFAETLTPEQLARKVREILDVTREPSAASTALLVTGGLLPARQCRTSLL